MNVPQDDLNLWRKFFHTLRQTMHDTKQALREGRTETAIRWIEQTGDAARRMGLRLEAAGADTPTGEPPRLGDVPLRLMDTPANRRYAEKLREAWEAGLEVDRERYGEKIGTDGCAQVIEMVLADVEQEIGGATSRLGE